RRIILSFQTNQINAANLCRVAIGDHERRNILNNFRAAAGDRESSDPTKLMYGRKAAHYRVVSHLNVTGQCAVIGENDMVAHAAIVADMAVGEKISAIADPGFAFARLSPINRNEFSTSVFVADFQVRRFAAIFQILCLLADRTVSIELVLRANLRRSAEGDVMLQPATWPEEDVRADNAVRTDVCPGTEFCSWIDNGRRVNLHVAHLCQPFTSILSPLCKGRGGKIVWFLGVRAWRAILEASPFARERGRMRVGLRSFVEEGKHQFGLGDDRVIYDAMAFRFSHAVAARPDELGVDEDGVAGQNWFAKFYFVGAHEVADPASGFRQLEQQNAGHLCHRFDLHDARHDGMTGEMSLE